MTTPGSQFPVVTQRGVQEWWVIPEGFAGQVVSGLTSGPALAVYTVTESTTKPPGEVAGPFTTQAQAQAVANQKNGQSQATPGNLVTSATSSIFTQTSFWVRAGEVLAGGILFYVGAKSLFPSAVNTVVTPVKNTAKGTFNAAKLGII